MDWFTAILFTIGYIIWAGVGLFLFICAVDYLINVPQQLRRIADALERRESDD